MPMVTWTASVTRYVTDTKLSKAIKNPDNIASLQRDFSAIYGWTEVDQHVF